MRFAVLALLPSATVRADKKTTQVHRTDLTVVAHDAEVEMLGCAFSAETRSSARPPWAARATTWGVTVVVVRENIGDGCGGWDYDDGVFIPIRE